ncbi:MAG: OmpH family outer membrane protein [Acidobacteria bacterium]|nr:OmpH family outer membrane protein [Acidobacteriota bacterium]
MRKVVPAMGLSFVLVAGGHALAQDKTPKMAIMNIQAAISQSSEGQQAAKELQAKFAPKRAELEKQQKEIMDLQNQLRNQEKVLSDEARTKLLRTIDDKTKAFNRTNEDATTEFQQAEQDAVNQIGQKMMGVISEYAKKNSYALILDVSQTPVLYADAALDVTEDIVGLYNQATAQAQPTSGSSAAPPASEQPSATPATPTPKPAPASEPPKPQTSPPASNP